MSAESVANLVRSASRHGHEEFISGEDYLRIKETWQPVSDFLPGDCIVFEGSMRPAIARTEYSGLVGRYRCVPHLLTRREQQLHDNDCLRGVPFGYQQIENSEDLVLCPFDIAQFKDASRAVSLMFDGGLVDENYADHWRRFLFNGWRVFAHPLLPVGSPLRQMFRDGIGRPFPPEILRLFPWLEPSYQRDTSKPHIRFRSTNALPMPLP